MAKIRYRDSAGYSRPIPPMLALRARLAPAWITGRWPRTTALAAVAVMIVLVLSWLPGSHPARCHPARGAGRAACR
jgi:hypothetical protein